MCRSNWLIKRVFFDLKVVLFFVLFFIVALDVNAESVRISLLLGDTHTKTAVSVIKLIEQKSLGVEIKIYPRRNIKTRDLGHLKSSNLIIVNIMDRQIVEEIKDELMFAISKGAKVYAVSASGSYNEEYKAMGIIYDENVDEYYKEGGIENLKNLIFYCLKKEFNLSVKPGEIIKIPDFAIYDYKKKKLYETFNEFVNEQEKEYIKRPLIGIVFYKNNYESGQMAHIDAIIQCLENEGFSVLPVFGYPSENAIERFFFDEKGNSIVNAVIALSLKVGLNPKFALPVLQKLGVPIINAISLYNQSEAEWKKSPIGLDINERSWQVALPELGGIIQPTIIASKERLIDEATGIEYIEEKPIIERINRLVKRVQGWINLQKKPNSEKKVAIIYYNYPPGKQNIGASYLNVLPESLFEIYQRLRKEGYTLNDYEIDRERLFNDVFNYGRNIGNWAQSEIDRLARTGKPILIPIETYKKWFEELPDGLKKSVIKDWGIPEDNKIMAWTGESGTKYIIIPAVKYGNILLMPQPSRGWEQDVQKLYHNLTIAPHHQYIAFYMYLKKDFQADALIHLGTHGTHEWLSGKEIGFSEEDAPEALIQDIPNIYPYIVDNVGEGTQAKRRGMAVIIDHMTPPFDKSGMNKELRELFELINDYRISKQKSLALAEAKISEITSLARKIGILTDLGLKDKEDRLNDNDIENLEHYIKEIMEKITPFGLHTFGKYPEEHFIKSTAQAMASVENNLTEQLRNDKIVDYINRIKESGKAELDAFINALNGKYIVAGTGNDPLRNPDSLPTGKNFYSFDPTKIPSRSTYELGVKLAKDLIEEYKKRRGEYPDKLTFNLWATETMRHEGVMDSQIMYLMGIRPRWDERGRVIGVEAIPRSELGRPRIDVTIVPSGLYRDLFSNLIALLDKAVTLAKEQKEEDNNILINVSKTKKMLINKGLLEEQAEKLATIRIFTEPPGAYGTNLDKIIAMSNTWDDEKKIVDVYFMRMGFMYGQGFWGSSPKENGFKNGEDLGQLLLKTALSGSKMVIHSRSTNTFATLDNDDFFQYLGGTAMAIRSLDGKTPEVFVTEMSNPLQPKQESIEKVMGMEMRTRYLNPYWIKAMLKEGYEGARFIDKVVEHLWGWQVTVPEAVDSAKWNEMYETYVLDRNGLGIKNIFREAKNLWAYQSIVARMLETIRKNYWKPDKQVIENLAKEYTQIVNEVGLACCDHTCNNPLLTKFTATVLLSVPGFKSQVDAFMQKLDEIKNTGKNKVINKDIKLSKYYNKAKIIPGGTDKKIEGFELQDVYVSNTPSAPIPYMFLLGCLIFVLLIYIGWKRGD